MPQTDQPDPVLARRRATQAVLVTFAVYGGYGLLGLSPLPADLRYLGDSNPWVGPGTVTSIRVKYLEDLDGIVEMQVGF